MLFGISVKPGKVILAGFCLFLFFGFTGEREDLGPRRLSKTSLNVFTKDVNNLRMPLDNKGVLADADPGSGAGGIFDGHTFLFSGGFYLGGYSNGNMWVNGVMSASRIEDYRPGPVGSAPDNAVNKLYIVTSQDEPFSAAWIEWKDAVAIGADFYDGDGDGVYAPVDKNGDGKWNTDEDRPDLIGDVTVWCVYNDGVPGVLRRFQQVSPQGIEIQQTVFGFASKATIGNMLFIRYRIINRGTVAETLDSVYFASVTDGDLGDYTDDLVGCDTLLSAGYYYNRGPDGQYGVNCPAFLIDFLQGPVVYIPGETFVDANNNGEFDAGETALTNAYNVRGVVKGKDTIPGAKNLPLTGCQQYMSSHPTHGDPSTHWELHYYLRGGAGRDGSPIDPCRWSFGNGSSTSSCSVWNNKFMYSGDPSTGTGWVNTVGIDQRLMLSSGPFKLVKDKPIDIVTAYLVGRSTLTSLQSINTVKEINRITQYIFDQNFPLSATPPAIKPVVASGNGYIELLFETAPALNYVVYDTIVDVNRSVQAFKVTAYKTGTKASQISGVINKKELFTYSLNNHIQSLFIRAKNGAVTPYLELPPASYLLDTVRYRDAEQGRIKIRITSDPFDGGPLVKGKEYYFVVSSVSVNHNLIRNRQTGTYGPVGDYIDTLLTAYDEFDSDLQRIVYESDVYSPPLVSFNSKKVSGYTEGEVRALPVNYSALTGDTYQVAFSSDTSGSVYNTSWTLKNIKTGATLVTNSSEYNFDSTDYSGKVTEGFVLRVKPVTPAVSSGTEQVYVPSQNKWFADLNTTTASLGAVYAGKDIAGVSGSNILGGRQSTITKANRLRSIEIRFGQPGKAYRYMNGFIGTSSLQRRASFRYAAGIGSADTVSTRGGSMGKFGQGFVDVPFQVWVKDSIYGEERQLAAGFVEKSGQLPGGNPDGEWFPGIDVVQSLEAILVFDADYDATGSQIEYTGGAFGSDTVWADIRGYQVPASGTSYSESQKRIAASPLFNALYVVGLNALSASAKPTAGDILKIPVAGYPYTDADIYSFSTSKGGALSSEQKMQLFEKLNVYPNPLFAYNPATSYNPAYSSDEPFVTFTNLPEQVTIKIYTISGVLIRTLSETDKRDGAVSPFLQWNLKNENNRRVASGMYMAVVSAQGFGEKILKFGVILPKKELSR